MQRSPSGADPGQTLYATLNGANLAVDRGVGHRECRVACRDVRDARMRGPCHSGRRVRPPPAGSGLPAVAGDRATAVPNRSLVVDTGLQSHLACATLGKGTGHAVVWMRGGPGAAVDHMLDSREQSARKIASGMDVCDVSGEKAGVILRHPKYEFHDFGLDARPDQLTE